MKMKLEIAGREIIIEAQGPVSVEVRELEAAAPSAPVAPSPAPVAPPSVPEEVPSLRLLPAAVPSAPPEGEALFARLSSLRRELAGAGGVPPYVIFNDKTLREMAEKLPGDLAAFGKIGGVGQAKLEKYGARFLAVIQGVGA
jgi:superfamily II DNA helicase RecQ